MKLPKITIRMGASYNDVTLNERGSKTTFDVATMDRTARRKFRRMLVAGLEQAGYFA